MSDETLVTLSGDRRAERVQQMLADLARKLGPNAKFPSTRELRKTLGVSQVTLDSALDGLEIRGLIERRHRSGVYVSPIARLRRVAVVLAHGILSVRTETFDHLLVKALCSEGLRRNFLVSVYFSDPDHNDNTHGPQQLVIDAQNGCIDAMIVRGVATPPVEGLQSVSIPAVFITTSESITPRIAMDGHTQVIADGVRLLADAGCRRIGFSYSMGLDASMSSTYPRSLEALNHAMASAGIASQKEWLIPFDREAFATRPLNASRSFFELWRDSPERPDGFLSTDDQFTAGVLHSAQLLNLNIPNDIMVVSHANKGLNLFGDFDVIRLEIDPVEVARGVLNTIDELLGPDAIVTSVREVGPHVVYPANAKVMDPEVWEMNQDKLVDKPEIRSRHSKKQSVAG